MSLVELGGAVEADDRPHGFEDSPSRVLRIAEYAAWTSSIVGAWYQNITSASARRAETSTDAADDETLLPADGASASSSSVASSARSASPSSAAAAKTEYAM